MKSRDIYVDYLHRQAALLCLEFDGEHKLLRMNHYAEQTLGADCLGKPAEQIFVDFSHSFSLQSFLDQPQATRLLNVSTVSGLPQTYYFSFAPQEVGVIALGQIDAAEMTALRQNLVQSNNELNNLTRELHKKSAELAKLNELKNHFLGMAAHDLRNPLAAIMGYSELMIMEPHAFKRPDFVELLNDIRYLSDFMLSMINDLLDISVIESGKLSLNPVPRNFSELLAKTVLVNQVFAEKEGIELRLVDRLPPGEIRIDPPRIKQVINNLISNAIKFSAASTTVTLVASLRGDDLEVAVSDQGPGIAAQDIQKLFQPYPEISTRSSGDERRTGLGLAICKKIMTTHRGDIRAESRLGQGSTFTFTLPGYTTGKAL
ncbi:MAG: HAMP domain-containing sensor histidine kinase [Desulfuromonadales bacterium]|nr:HAMP domain-containing sensor histidine kinase [Desulfuromonadales bacterium]